MYLLKKNKRIKEWKKLYFKRTYFYDQQTQKLPGNEIIFYQSIDGAVYVEVLYSKENIWLTQKRMAELFDTTPQNITQHLKNIYFEKEIDESATCKNFLQVQIEGEREVSRKVKFY